MLQLILMEAAPPRAASPPPGPRSYRVEAVHQLMPVPSTGPGSGARPHSRRPRNASREYRCHRRAPKRAASAPFLPRWLANWNSRPTSCAPFSSLPPGCFRTTHRSIAPAHRERRVALAVAELSYFNLGDVARRADRLVQIVDEFRRVERVAFARLRLGGSLCRTCPRIVWLRVRLPGSGGRGPRRRSLCFAMTICGWRRRPIGDAMIWLFASFGTHRRVEDAAADLHGRPLRASRQQNQCSFQPRRGCNED